MSWYPNEWRDICQGDKWRDMCPGDEWRDMPKSRRMQGILSPPLLPQPPLWTWEFVIFTRFSELVILQMTHIWQTYSATLPTYQCPLTEWVISICHGTNEWWELHIWDTVLRAYRSCSSSIRTREAWRTLHAVAHMNESRPVYKGGLSPFINLPLRIYPWGMSHHERMFVCVFACAPRTSVK